MTLKRFFLAILTLGVIIYVILYLVNSWNKPQFQSRLELYQTDLVLNLAELPETPGQDDPLRKTLIGTEDPIKAALTQYQEARQQIEKSLHKTETSAASSQPPNLTREQQAEAEVVKQQTLLQEVNLRIGLLQVQQNQVSAGLDTWKQLSQTAEPTANTETAAVLSGLWRDPSQLLPNAEAQIQRHLDGWFRYRALLKLYDLQQRPDEIATLRQAEQTTAEQAAQKLIVIGTLPLVGVIFGSGLLLFLLGQAWLKGKESLLAGISDMTWTVPWDGEVIWQVLVGGFFFAGQFIPNFFVIPIVLSLVQNQTGSSVADLDERSRAVFTILFPYLLLALGTLSVFYGSVQPYFPLAQNWFRCRWQSRWWAWGVGGYLVALPLVILVSWVNQKIWQGQGGSNPILPIVMEGKDPTAMAIFLITAAIAAPLFEEFLFRGFLLSSLTRYFPTWGAIVLSSLIFAVAHLSLSEVLPLMTLGIVLGFVYTRSQNLLSSMLLHSLWNSGTLLSLFILGSGNHS
jgi:uncharacterized protein